MLIFLIMNYSVKTMPWPHTDGCMKPVMTVLYVGTKKNVYLAAGDRGLSRLDSPFDISVFRNAFNGSRDTKGI